MTSIVKNQHILPGKSISRFCNPNGMVCLNLLTHNLVRPANPNDKIFTEYRSWDQSAEQGYGLKIENSFQSLVEEIINSNQYIGCKYTNRVITEFYALWLVRSNVNIGIKHYENVNWRGLGNEKYSPQQKENAELKHAMYIEEGNIPLRFVIGGWMQREITFFVDSNSHAQWYLCESKNIELLVSDNPYPKMFIPISPKLCLSTDYKGGFLPDEKVREINIDAIVNSKKYYFARDINKCIYSI